MTEELNEYEITGLVVITTAGGLGLGIMLPQLSINPASVGVVLCLASFILLMYGRKKKEGENHD